MEQQRFNGIWFQAAQQQIPCLPAASELPSTATVRLRLWRTFCSRLSLAPSRDTTWRALAAGWRDSAQANVAAQQGWEAHSAHEHTPYCPSSTHLPAALAGVLLQRCQLHEGRAAKDNLSGSESLGVLEASLLCRAPVSNQQQACP